jgi:hypothetical protein
MKYTGLNYSATRELASLQIDAYAFCKLAPLWRAQLNQTVNCYSIPVPGSPQVSPVDPYGGPIRVLVAGPNAAYVRLQVELMFRAALG